MRKVISIFLSIVIITTILMPIRANAATLASKAGVVTLTSGRLNVRSSASTGSSVVARLDDGSYVTLISKSGSWWYVEYAKGKYGYCHANYISSLSSSAAAIVNTQYSNLNIRSGAGTSYSRLGTLQKGETVVVLSASGSWSRILYHGTKTGYVTSKYLTSSSGYSAVSLSVPSFKQTDSRWANTTIGTSGKTIAKIGCATAAIAMLESYRTGQTIYPNAMAKKLSYTSSGSVYWPNNYTPVTNSSGYLNAIYDQLKLGKPVLFGAKTSAGSQHWVVITGYTGGSPLTASGFTINDPGSNYRTNLQQLLNSYPLFYKYFYYN